MPTVNLCLNIANDETSSDGGRADQLSTDASGTFDGWDEFGMRGMLELSCDWYWNLDAQWRLVRLRGQHEQAGTARALAPLGKAPWEWPGAVADSAEFEKLRSALLQRQRFHDLEFVTRDHQGQLRYLAVSGEPLFDKDARFVGYHGTTRDVTQRRRAEALVAVEHAVTRNLAEASNSRKILQAVMQVICESEQWETAGFFRTEDESGKTRLVAGWSGPRMSQTAADYYRHTSDKIIPSGGLLSQVIATAKPLWVAAMTESQTTWSQRVQKTGERATVFFPVLVDGQVIGVFAFSSCEIREPDERLLQTMRVIGEQVGQFLKRKQAEQVLRESEARFRALTELSSDWYWELDAEFRLTRVEGRDFEGRESVPGQSALGKPRWENGLEVEAPGGWEAHRAQLAAQLPLRDVVLIRSGTDGTRCFISISGEPMREPNGTFLGFRGVGRDITERKLSENRIQHLATHDGLTGLPNRVLFSELLQGAIRSAARYPSGFAVMFIDLDRFKIINDTLGHEAGDTLLKEIAKRLVACVRASDVAARLSGDEFVVLLQHMEHADEIATVARKILAAIAHPVVVQGGDYRVTASVGISRYAVDALDEQSLMQNADAAMYAAKHNGKNAFEFYTSEIASVSSQRLALEFQLRGALERDEFSLHYQPKLDLMTRAIVGVEALLRWNNPELGLVPPAQFIELTEQSGLILPIGKWVLRQACQQYMDWQRQGVPPITMSVNVSARQFADEFLLGDIAVVLRETGMSPERLELEITEGVVITNVDRAIKLLRSLKGMGVRLAIDDFGTGYSSLSQLKNLPIDTLKIDRSFIRDLPINAQDKAITEAIIGIGKALNMTVIAEGVETQDQERYLLEQACDQLQGYHFSKPISATEFVDLWRRYAASSHDVFRAVNTARPSGKGSSTGTRAARRPRRA